MFRLKNIYGIVFVTEKQKYWGIINEAKNTWCCSLYYKQYIIYYGRRRSIRKPDRRVDSYSFAPSLFVRQKSKLASLKQLIFALHYTRKTAESARRLSVLPYFSPVCSKYDI